MYFTSHSLRPQSTFIGNPLRRIYIYIHTHMELRVRLGRLRGWVFGAFRVSGFSGVAYRCSSCLDLAQDPIMGPQKST